jgi:hypothetical protein
VTEQRPRQLIRIDLTSGILHRVLILFFILACLKIQPLKFLGSNLNGQSRQMY